MNIDNEWSKFLSSNNDEDDDDLDDDFYVKIKNYNFII